MFLSFSKMCSSKTGTCHHALWLPDVCGKMFMCEQRKQMHFVQCSVCACVYVCAHVWLREGLHIFACPLLSACERMWWTARSEFEPEEGRKWLNRKKDATIHSTSCLSTLCPVCSRSSVFIVMFRSSSSNSPFCPQVHVCQWLLLSLSSLTVLDQITVSVVLYLLFYFKFISLCVTIPLINQIHITKVVLFFL